MKTIRLFGVALMTVLLSVSLSSCSKSDDDNGSTSASIEGTWYSTSQTWYSWDKGKDAPDYSDSYKITDKETFIITKSATGYKLIYRYKEKGSNKEAEDVMDLVQNAENDFNADNYIRIVFKNIKSNSMELECWDGYYSKNGTNEYGIVYLTK